MEEAAALSVVMVGLEDGTVFSIEVGLLEGALGGFEDWERLAAAGAIVTEAVKSCKEGSVLGLAGLLDRAELSMEQDAGSDTRGPVEEGEDISGGFSSGLPP